MNLEIEGVRWPRSWATAIWSAAASCSASRHFGRYYVEMEYRLGASVDFLLTATLAAAHRGRACRPAGFRHVSARRPVTASRRLRPSAASVASRDLSPQRSRGAEPDRGALESHRPPTLPSDHALRWAAGSAVEHTAWRRRFASAGSACSWAGCRGGSRRRSGGTKRSTSLQRHAAQALRVRSEATEHFWVPAY